jgi:malate dehydrogenase
MKISVIGAGNVGSLTAMRLLDENLGQIVLVDIVKGLAKGKAFDLEDASHILKNAYNIQGTDDFSQVADSDIIVVTAGLPRKPGMTREELLNKNAMILKDVCLNIKRISPKAIVIIVTNPLDLMTYFALKITGFSPDKLFGMGVSLDAARFANIISKQLNIPVTQIEPCVVGSHGEGMLPLARFTKINGQGLEKLLKPQEITDLISSTILRGAEIVSLLGSGSAFFAPSAAIAELVKSVAQDQKRTIGICAYLNGEYGLNDICLGVPGIIGRNGIEKVVELELNRQERELLNNCAEKMRTLIETLPY